MKNLNIIFYNFIKMEFDFDLTVLLMWFILIIKNNKKNIWVQIFYIDSLIKIFFFILYYK